MSFMICVRNQKILVHHYPEAKHCVRFLRTPHRHVFYVKTCIGVVNSREVEFFIFQEFIDQVLEKFKEEQDGGSFSCEDLALYIKEKVKLDYFTSRVKIEVSEDGENSAILDSAYHI